MTDKITMRPVEVLIPYARNARTQGVTLGKIQVHSR
jgi:hypothetical protein